MFKSGTTFDFEMLATRFDEQAYLNAGLNITLHDERPPAKRRGIPVGNANDVVQDHATYVGDDADGHVAVAFVGGAVGGSLLLDTVEDVATPGRLPASQPSSVPSRMYNSRVFCHAGGIAEYVDHICDGKRPLFDEPSTITLSQTRRGVHVDAALRWNADMYSESILGFANGVHTPQGGTHQDGLKSALTRVLNAQARAVGKLKEKSSNLGGDFLREGLCVVVAVKLKSVAVVRLWG